MARRSTLAFFVISAVALLATGCFLDRSALGDPPNRPDAARPDGGSPEDGGERDGGQRDGGQRDGGQRDGGQPPEDGGTDADTCTPSGTERCDGLDNDCDPATPDGAEDPRLREACDDADADACADGALACIDGALACAGDDGDQPDEIERCDGLDNDCDAATADGAGEPWLGAACDDPLDADLCADGASACAGGVRVCAGDDGDLPDEVERCDGLDNDCNPSTLDGASEPWLGAACDDPLDADLCAEGTSQCVSATRACTGDDGDQPGEVERCDGLDNDCNPGTLDGASEPWLGAACDDPLDADLCAEGTSACVSATRACTGDDGDRADEIELCDGLDNDCNPATVDGASEVGGAACDGSDADLCREGTTSICTAGVLVCSDDTGDNVELCDGADNDCDGTIDEGAGCPCTHVARGARSYLFCGLTGQRRTWYGARDACRALGYELVTIDGAAEQAFVYAQASAISPNPWWIGLNDIAAEGSWVWVGTSAAATYTPWQTGQPNGNPSSGDQDCVILDPDGASAGGTPGGWNDGECWGFAFRYACEAGAAITTTP